MLQGVIKKDKNKIKATLFFLFILFLSSKNLYSSFLQSSTILSHKDYDLALGIPIIKNATDFVSRDSYSGGVGVRSGFGLFNFSDINFLVAKLGNMNPTANISLRFGIPKDWYPLRASISFGVGYAKFSGNFYTGYVESDNLQFPIDMMFSGSINLDFVSLDPYLGLCFLLNKYKGGTGINKGDTEGFYTAKAGIVISPASFKITKIVFETQQSLRTRTKIMLGDSYVIGLVFLIQALGNTNYLSF